MPPCSTDNCYYSHYSNNCYNYSTWPWVGSSGENLLYPSASPNQPAAKVNISYNYDSNTDYNLTGNL